MWRLLRAHWRMRWYGWCLAFGLLVFCALFPLFLFWPYLSGAEEIGLRRWTAMTVILPCAMAMTTEIEALRALAVACGQPRRLGAGAALLFMLVTALAALATVALGAWLYATNTGATLPHLPAFLEALWRNALLAIAFVFCFMTFLGFLEERLPGTAGQIGVLALLLVVLLAAGALVGSSGALDGLVAAPLRGQSLATLPTFILTMGIPLALGLLLTPLSIAKRKRMKW